MPMRHWTGSKESCPFVIWALNPHLSQPGHEAPAACRAQGKQCVTTGRTSQSPAQSGT